MATSPSNLPERPASAGSSPKSFPMTSIPLSGSNTIANGHVASFNPSTGCTITQSSGKQNNASTGLDPANAKFTLVRASEAYPRPSGIPQTNGLQSEQDTSDAGGLNGTSALGALDNEDFRNGIGKLPFEEIPGEWTVRMAKTRDGKVILSNYRLHVSIDHRSDEEEEKVGNGLMAHSNIGMNVPLGCIESVEQRDLFYLDVYCKDGRYYRIRFDDNSSCEDWQRYVNQSIAPPQKIQDVFGFGHRAWAEEQGFEELANICHRIRHPTDASSATGTSSVNGHMQEDSDGYENIPFTSGQGHNTWFRSEIARLKFDVRGAWRTSLANTDHKLCPTYPPEILVPAFISDAELEKCAAFRSARRLHAVVWRHVGNGACLARCSQPEVGWLGWRSTNDESLVKAIAEACAFDRASAAGASKAILQQQSNVTQCLTTTSTTNADSNISNGHTSIPLSNGNEHHSTALTATNGPETNANGDIPSLKDLSAEAAAVVDATNGDPDKGHLKKVLIMDARSYAAAVGNRARGGGVECPEYYPNAEITFMNLANIHTIRRSHQSVRNLLHSQPEQTSATWFTQIDNTKWLHHLSGLIKASVKVCTALQIEQRPVIVHCSDGWDRTPQIVALAELMLDPYYRSIDGFQVLVEKEWLDFGHKMGDRCGNAFSTSDLNERSPVFLQWLDCVHQLLLQFPCHFEFNLSFVVKLAHHTYSSLFGTFLCNSALERKEHRVHEQTRSVWNFLKHHPHKFNNLLYTAPSSQSDEQSVLWPRSEVRDMLLWNDVYMSEQRYVGSNVGHASNSSTRESNHAKVRSSSANGIVPGGTAGQPPSANGTSRSGCVSSDQIDSGAASSRDGSEIYEGELNSREITEQLEKLHVNVPTTCPSEKIVPNLCLHNESLSSVEGTSNLNSSATGLPINMNKSTSAAVGLGSKTMGINEKSTDTLVPDCDIIERSSKLSNTGGQHCDQSKTSSNISIDLSAYKLSKPPSKDSLPLAEVDEAKEKSPNKDTNTNTLPNHNTSQKLPACHHMNSPYLTTTQQQQQHPPCINNTANGNCCSSDDFSTEEEDGQVGNVGLDTAASSRHNTSSQTSSQNVLLAELENCSPYDSDGLLSHHNEVQRRLVSIVSAHKKQVNHLKRDLYLTRMALCRSKLAHHNHHNQSNQSDPTNLTNGIVDGHSISGNSGRRGTGCGHGIAIAGNGGIGNHSGGCNSSVQSDTSWEAVDEKEARPTLWVPDHAASSCMRCHTQFSFVRRKHHCRNCGQLFCGECSDNLAPIPSEQLYHPVRICEECFQKLYPEEAAKKAQEIADLEAKKHETTELNTTSYQLEQPPLNVSSLAHQENGIIQSTADITSDTYNTLLTECTSENIAITKMNVDQPISNGVYHAGDNNKEDDKQHQLIEGEACVVLKTNQS